MDTIELKDYGVFHGTHRGSLGVYTDEENGSTYAGERVDAVAHGYAVFKWSNGNTISGQFANGRWHGHREYHRPGGDVEYQLCEHGNFVHSATVRSDGACFYDNQPCGADHADYVALNAAAQQAAVRTCPAP